MATANSSTSDPSISSPHTQTANETAIAVWKIARNPNASAFARTEFQVVQFLPVFVFPQVLLGGIFLPTDQLPAGLEAISGWLPLTYAIDALNAVSTGDEDTAWIITKLLVVIAWIIGSIVLGSVTLRRRTP